MLSPMPMPLGHADRERDDVLHRAPAISTPTTSRGCTAGSSPSSRSCATRSARSWSAHATTVAVGWRSAISRRQVGARHHGDALGVDAGDLGHHLAHPPVACRARRPWSGSRAARPARWRRPSAVRFSRSIWDGTRARRSRRRRAPRRRRSWRARRPGRSTPGRYSVLRCALVDLGDDLVASRPHTVHVRSRRRRGPPRRSCPRCRCPGRRCGRTTCQRCSARCEPAGRALAVLARGRTGVGGGSPRAAPPTRATRASMIRSVAAASTSASTGGRAGRRQVDRRARPRRGRVCGGSSRGTLPYRRQQRCAPHCPIGTTGHPVSSAIRAAPVLPRIGHRSGSRVSVPSGKTATQLAGPHRLHGGGEGARGVRGPAVHRDLAGAAQDGAQRAGPGTGSPWRGSA